MINITDFKNYYSSNFQAFFDGTEMLEYEEDILRHIIYNMLEMMQEWEVWDIKECIAINIKQYFQDNYIESSDIDPDEAEKDSYDFIYQYDIIENLHIILKDNIDKYIKSNNYDVVWNEDIDMIFLKENDIEYLTFANNEIVKYTDTFDLHNSSNLSKKGFNRLIDLSNEFIVYKNIVGDNHDIMFFKLVEYYLSLKDRSLINFYDKYKEVIPIDVKGNYVDDYNLIEYETFKLIYPLFNQTKINSIKFNGWIRDTTKIRSTDV